jgi:hypothetical protein
VAVTLQQGWVFAIPISPHCSAIFLQQSRSADVIATPGNTQAATGSAASISARAETPTLISNLNITSLSTPDSKTQQAGKGFSLLPSRDQPDRGLSENASTETVERNPAGLSELSHGRHRPRASGLRNSLLLLTAF